MTIQLRAQTSYSWATYPTRCFGASVYTQPNMTVDVTGTGFANYGPQCAASTCASTSGNRYFSPKYVTSPNASAPDWQYNGLALGVNWSNTSSNATVVITFTTPVCGPLTFSVYDVNSGTWGGYNPVWRDRVTFSGTNDVGATITPSSISACGGNAIIGNRIDATIAGTGCTNGVHNITYNSTLIKTITITYTSMGIDPTYGTDPDPEYIIISNLTSTTCVLPEIQDITTHCAGSHPTLTWSTPPGEAPAEYLIYRSTNSTDVALAARLDDKDLKGSHALSWSDPQDATNATYYQLVSLDDNGASTTHDWVAAKCACDKALVAYPNPATEVLTLEIPWLASDEFLQISVFDMAGRIILDMKEDIAPDADATWQIRQLDVSQLAPGIYTVQCNAGGRRMSQRLQVE